MKKIVKKSCLGFALMTVCFQLIGSEKNMSDFKRQQQLDFQRALREIQIESSSISTLHEEKKETSQDCDDITQLLSSVSLEGQPVRYSDQHNQPNNQPIQTIFTKEFLLSEFRRVETISEASLLANEARFWLGLLGTVMVEYKNYTDYRIRNLDWDLSNATGFKKALEDIEVKIKKCNENISKNVNVDMNTVCLSSHKGVLRWYQNRYTVEINCLRNIALRAIGTLHNNSDIISMRMSTNK